ncbi:MAG: DNA-protecting protein DprA, partial [Gemmatimonadetes bacterium]|nr:DNA-protecting protein DprA [Gemmatimonadota bacterium]
MRSENTTTATTNSATPVTLADGLAVADAGFELPSLGDGDKVDLLALTRLPGIGPKRCLTLLQTFGSARDTLAAPVAEWAQVVGRRVAQEARRKPLDRRWAEAQRAHVERLGGCMVTISDADYPALLGEISVPPPVLFSLGAPVWTGPCVAVVGSRRATQYGRRMARDLSRELTRSGICVVSGMARGIDSAAHEGAIEGGGNTTAVPGCGADVVFPQENRGLYRKILERGAVLSEFPMGERPSSGSFPRRNRIISGLSLGVVVVETPERSGALITARYATEQNRQVYAVPGEALSGRNTGCHRLIRDGARLVETVD